VIATFLVGNRYASPPSAPQSSPNRTSWQFCSLELLASSCWDNAVAESFFATLKNELIYRHVWPTRRHAELAIFEFTAGWYNQYRRHSTLGYSSPAEVERRTSPATLAA
jgi:transposase InsO family protein